MANEETRHIERWLPFYAAVIPVVMSFALVYWQTNKAVVANQNVVTGFTTAVKNSNDLRRAVIRPLEGRWDYSVDWDVYFDVESSPQDRSQQFFSSGIADIHWRSGFYQVLLGYENANRAGDKYAVSVNTGTFASPESGLPHVGARIEMSYSHRLGRDQVQVGDVTVDYSDPPEDRYHYTIERFELAPDGQVEKIHARFEIDMSKGAVTFSRIH